MSSGCLTNVSLLEFLRGGGSGVTCVKNVVIGQIVYDVINNPVDIKLATNVSYHYRFEMATIETMNLPAVLNFVDEVERALKRIQVQRLNILLRYLYATKVSEAFAETVRDTCYGCEIDHPSQLQHTCLDPEVALGPEQWYFLHDQAVQSVEKSYLIALFVESAHLLKYDTTLINIDSTLEEIRQCWERTDYKQLDRDLEEEI